MAGRLEGVPDGPPAGLRHHGRDRRLAVLRAAPFEESYWEHHENWTAEEAALYGSSHYDLPAPFRWLTANIGIHHVHHLYSRIPYYRLPQVLRDFPELANIRRFGFIESLACLKLRFWDEDKRKMVGLKEALA